MEAPSLGPAQPPSPSIDPATQALQRQAEEDRVSALRERLSREARDTLIRFGRQKAFAGVGDMGGLGGGLTSLTGGGLGGGVR